MFGIVIVKTEGGWGEEFWALVTVLFLFYLRTFGKNTLLYLKVYTDSAKSLS